MKKQKYNHAFDIAFEVISKEKNPENVKPPELLVGMLRRIANMVEEDFENEGRGYGASVFIEATDCHDTYQQEEEANVS